MEIFSKIAERRIKQAIEDGAFDNLQRSGSPLKLDDETWVPEDLRAAYRVLKNAGFIPPELELRKEILNLRELISTIDDDKARLKKLRELNYKILKLNTMRERPLILEGFPEYETKIIERWTR